MELLALSAPWILLLLTVVAIGLLIFRRWKMAVVLLVLAMVGNWYLKVYGLGFMSDGLGGLEVQADELKVISFNSNFSKKHLARAEKRARLIEFIREQNADVVFLTENYIKKEDSIGLEIQEQYPFRSKMTNSVGNRLYSKFPIVCDTILKDKKMAYGITCCQIDLSGKFVNVLGVHLSSNNYNEHKVYMTPDSVTSGKQAITYISNIISASKCREKEASLIVNFLDSINSTSGTLPTIVMGDFNDVCGSPTLNLLENAGLKDAWWEGGMGYGSTFHNGCMQFRIDHVLYNNGFKLKSVKKIDAKKLSDHDALVGYFDFDN